MMTSSVPFPVLVHPYSSKVSGSCLYELGNTTATNALLFVGGLFDGPQTVPYIRTVVKHLEVAGDIGYSVFEMRLRSSFTGFGTSSLAKDVEDISAAVKYLRGIGRERIVLMGHSTGCQDCMEYTKYDTYNNEPVDAFIVQAPLSDREAMETTGSNFKKVLPDAERMMSDGKGQDIMPGSDARAVLGVPITAYRLWSLAAKGGDDDYFSSDLDDETVTKVWGRFKKPVLILHSAEDEYVPPTVSQEELNAKYKTKNALISPLSGLIPGAGHTVLGEESRQWLAVRVVEFLKTLS